MSRRLLRLAGYAVAFAAWGDIQYQAGLRHRTCDGCGRPCAKVSRCWDCESINQSTVRRIA